MNEKKTNHQQKDEKCVLAKAHTTRELGREEKNQWYFATATTGKKIRALEKPSLIMANLKYKVVTNVLLHVDTEIRTS